MLMFSHRHAGRCMCISHEAVFWWPTFDFLQVICGECNKNKFLADGLWYLLGYLFSVQLEKRGLETQIKQEEAAKGRVEQEKSSLKQEIDNLQKKLQQSELVCHPSPEGCLMEM